MLTQHDIDVMRNEVMGILKSWGSTADIYIPKSKEQQQYYDSVLREYTGDISYDVIENVPTERLEVVNKYYNDVTHIKAGKKVESEMSYKFPETFNGNKLTITDDMLFVFDGNTDHKYKVESIRERIGETIVDVSIISGGTDSGW